MRTTSPAGAGRQEGAGWVFFPRSGLGVLPYVGAPAETLSDQHVFPSVKYPILGCNGESGGIDITASWEGSTSWWPSVGYGSVCGHRWEELGFRNSIRVIMGGYPIMRWR